MIDADDEALLDTLAELGDRELHATAAAHWSTTRTASLLLALLERLAPHDHFRVAAVTCARHALGARSTPEPELAGALDAAASSPEAARFAARTAYNHVSPAVAGVDDDVALAVAEACDLVAGDPFAYGGPDPAARASWAWAWRRCGPGAARDDVERMEATVQAELADLLRERLGTTPPQPAAETRRRH